MIPFSVISFRKKSFSSILAFNASGDRTIISQSKGGGIAVLISTAFMYGGPSCGMTTSTSTSESSVGFPYA